jgi:proline iminopeptidase
LVIQGKDDIIMVETAQEIFDSFGNAKMILLDNCGHYGWLDARDQYLTAVREFL